MVALRTSSKLRLGLSVDLLSLPVRNIILNQNDSEIKNATIKRSIGTIGQTTKSISLYYGLNYPVVGQYEVMNNEGMLTNSTGERLIN